MAIKGFTDRMSARVQLSVAQKGVSLLRRMDGAQKTDSAKYSDDDVNQTKGAVKQALDSMAPALREVGDKLSTDQATVQGEAKALRSFLVGLHDKYTSIPDSELEQRVADVIVASYAEKHEIPAEQAGPELLGKALEENTKQQRELKAFLQIFPSQTKKLSTMIVDALRIADAKPEQVVALAKQAEGFSAVLSDMELSSDLMALGRKLSMLEPIRELLLLAADAVLMEGDASGNLDKMMQEPEFQQKVSQALSSPELSEFVDGDVMNQLARIKVLFNKSSK